MLSALDSFFGAIGRDRFPRLHVRTALCLLLVKITACKAINQRKQQEAQIRRPQEGKVLTEEAGVLEQLVGDEPSPEFAVQMAEQYQRLMNLLPGDPLRTVAQMKLEGYRNAEIADRLGVVERTVEFKLQRIRSIWKKETQA